VLGIAASVILRIDPITGTPIAPFAYLVNPFSQSSIELDVTTGHQRSTAYDVTQNAMQDATDAASNVHKRPEELSLTGVLVSGIDFGPLGAAGAPSPLGAGLRMDLVKLRNLRQLADRREVLMVVTPRGSLPMAFVTAISESWTNESGHISLISINFREARIVNPLAPTQAVPDVAGLEPGNNSMTDVGSQTGAPVETQTITPGANATVAPGVVAA
jgi:hypothetical protein